MDDSEVKPVASPGMAKKDVIIEQVTNPPKRNYHYSSVFDNYNIIIISLKLPLEESTKTTLSPFTNHKTCWGGCF
jgi:hypothetical protein